MDRITQSGELIPPVPARARVFLEGGDFVAVAVPARFRFLVMVTDDTCAGEIGVKVMFLIS